MNNCILGNDPGLSFKVKFTSYVCFTYNEDFFDFL
jgi:hypothetical protein